MTLVAVRATINMPGLGVSDEALVDDADPFIQDLLSAQYLVPVAVDEPPPDEPPEDWPVPE